MVMTGEWCIYGVEKSHMTWDLLGSPRQMMRINVVLAFLPSLDQFPGRSLYHGGFLQRCCWDLCFWGGDFHETYGKHV